MLVTLIGISTEVKPEELKALVPIPVKLSGSLMEAKLEQEKKAQFPILVTLFGISTEVKPVQYRYL